MTNMNSRILVTIKSLLAPKVITLGFILVTVGASCDEELDQLERKLFDTSSDSLKPFEYYETLKQWEALAGTRQLDRPLASKIRTMLEMSEIDKSRCSKELLRKFQLIYQDQSWSLTRKAKDYTCFVALMQFNTCVQQFDRISKRNMNTMTIEHKNMLSVLLDGASWLGETKIHHKLVMENGLYGNECHLHTETRRLVASAAYYMWQKVEGISRADHHSDEQHWEHFSRAYHKLFGGSFCDPIRETYRESGGDWDYSSLLIWVRWKFKLEFYKEWDHMELLCHFLVLKGNFGAGMTYAYLKRHLDGRIRFYPAHPDEGLFQTLRTVISRDLLDGIHSPREVTWIRRLMEKVGMGNDAFGTRYLHIHETKEYLKKLVDIWPPNLVNEDLRMDGRLANDLLGLSNFHQSQCDSPQQFEKRLSLAITFRSNFYNLSPYVTRYSQMFHVVCNMLIRYEADRIISLVPRDRVMRLEQIRRHEIRQLLGHEDQTKTHLGIAKSVVDQALLQLTRKALLENTLKGQESLRAFSAKLEGIRRELCEGLRGPQVNRLLERVDVQYGVMPELLMGQGTKVIVTYMRLCEAGRVDEDKLSTAFNNFKIEVATLHPKSRKSLLSCLKPEVRP